MGFYFATDRGTDLHECQEDGIITERYDEGRQMVLSDKDDLEKASVRKKDFFPDPRHYLSWMPVYTVLMLNGVRRIAI